MKIYANAAGRTVVEGELEELRAAGVLKPDDKIPLAAPGYHEKPERGHWVKVSRLRNGALRVRGRHLEAAKADEDFRRFLAQATDGKRRR